MTTIVIVGLVLFVLLLWSVATTPDINRDGRLKDESLTCRKCGELAAPIEGTKNRYRCPNGHQFAGSRHTFNP